MIPPQLLFTEGCFKLPCQKRFLNNIYKMRSSKPQGPDGIHPPILKECTYQCENVMCNLSLGINLIPRETENNECDTIFKQSGKIWGTTDQKISLPYRGNYEGCNKI